MNDPTSDDDLDLLSPSDALELVLDLAQRQVRRNQGRSGPMEADRLARQAALEQLDYLLMDHWEALDALARGDLVPASPTRSRHIWRLRSGVRVEQSPSAALECVIGLAERELEAGGLQSGSGYDAVRWAHYFLQRRRAALDAHFAQELG
ncbi:MAG: hypothetical protein JJT90_07910 [Ectothiorhodospiraceae bacterium]|nr:hypothetical protein [Ectothiorhodospiraceae bacterium]